MTKQSGSIEIFKAGRHTTMAGDALEFSASDLEATVNAYDPAVFAAPIVVGHPKINAPAYGWVKALALDGQRQPKLLANPDQVEPQFAAMVNAGRFKKVSASFFHPQAKDNPVPGVYYLRHVGFLGAAAPAVQGLKDAEFSADGNGYVTVEFAAPGTYAISRIVRGLRDFLIEKFDLETADRVIPDWMAQDVEAAAREPVAEAPAFAVDPEEATVNPKDKQEQDRQAAEFAARETELAEREAKLKEREATAEKAAQAARHAEFESFAEAQIAAGRVLPAEKAGLIAFMASLDAAGEISFASGEGQAETKTSGADWLKGFIAAQPPRVDFAERGARGEHEAGGSVSFAAPNGYSVPADRAELHQKALAYQRQHNCSYETAAAAVGA